MIRGDENLERDSELFSLFERNYWGYYLELENQLLQIKRYVDFDKINFNTYSIEFLKLFQTICSEIDVVGKIMAHSANPDFSPEDRQNNIYKWWYEIQNVYKLNDELETDRQDNLKDYRCKFLDEIIFYPWRNFEIEKYKDKKNATRFRLTNKSNTLTWWSDYNKVKHNRITLINNRTKNINFFKANLGNVCISLSALYVLEKAFMNTIGTDDDLQNFKDFSKIFEKNKRQTRNEKRVMESTVYFSK